MPVFEEVVGCANDDALQHSCHSLLLEVARGGIPFVDMCSVGLV